VADSCEHGNEHSGSIRGGKFIDCIRTVRISRWTLLHGVCQVVS